MKRIFRFVAVALFVGLSIIPSFAWEKEVQCSLLASNALPLKSDVGDASSTILSPHKQSMNASPAMETQEKPTIPGYAPIVRFAIERYPGFVYNYCEPLTLISRDFASVTPTLTYTLTLVNAGNAASPTTILSKVISVASDGSGFATFTNVPALTAIACVHIDNGYISYWKDFHGAIDLIADKENLIYLSPMGSKNLLDLETEVTRRLVTSTSFQSQIIPKLVARVHTAMGSFLKGSFPNDLGQGKWMSPREPSYDNAMRSFFEFTRTLRRFVTASPTIVIDGIFGAGETILRVASPGSELDGFEIRNGGGGFASGTRVRITAASILSQAFLDNLTPISPMISIDTGKQWPDELLVVTIPINIPARKLPIVYLFFPTTGELSPLCIVDVTDKSISIIGGNFLAPISRTTPQGFVVFSYFP
ncbi:MAG: hypothetical protein WA705_00080 [Candidatus Ozemobacteraceae bacterium]